MYCAPLSKTVANNAIVTRMDGSENVLPSGELVERPFIAFSGIQVYYGPILDFFPKKSRVFFEFFFEVRKDPGKGGQTRNPNSLGRRGILY